MTRISKVVITLVALAVVVFIALAVAAHFKPRSNKLATWLVNLEQIENAKTTWADNRVGTTNDTPTLDDLRPYFSDWVNDHIFVTNGVVVDPDGGVYIIGRIGEQPSCFVGGRRRHL